MLLLHQPFGAIDPDHQAAGAEIELAQQVSAIQVRERLAVGHNERMRIRLTHVAIVLYENTAVLSGEILARDKISGGEGPAGRPPYLSIDACRQHFPFEVGTVHATGEGDHGHRQGVGGHGLGAGDVYLDGQDLLVARRSFNFAERALCKRTDTCCAKEQR